MALGHDRERAWVKLNREAGRFAMRAPASLGVCDVVVLEAGEKPCLDELKANKDGGPYMNFRPADRAALIEAAEKAGAVARLVYWPVRSNPTVILSEAWPK